MLRSHELLVLFIQFNLGEYFSNFRYSNNSTLYNFLQYTKRLAYLRKNIYSLIHTLFYARCW